jgi:hypothetical protein
VIREKIPKRTTTPSVIAFPWPKYSQTTATLKTAKNASPKPSKTRSTLGSVLIDLNIVFTFPIRCQHGAL